MQITSQKLGKRFVPEIQEKNIRTYIWISYIQGTRRDDWGGVQLLIFEWAPYFSRLEQKNEWNWKGKLNRRPLQIFYQQHSPSLWCGEHKTAIHLFLFSYFFQARDRPIEIDVCLCLLCNPTRLVNSSLFMCILIFRFFELRARMSYLISMPCSLFG